MNVARRIVALERAMRQATSPDIDAWLKAQSDGDVDLLAWIAEHPETWEVEISPENMARLETLNAGYVAHIGESRG